jgi:hypothetical protein
MTVRTHTHTMTPLANPHIQCAECGEQVTSFHCAETCGCTGSSWNWPCRHDADTHNTCPTWSPVDGCQCIPNGGETA